ncbi:MAG: hypothetical protein A2X59_05850 [Nitrospirae bacterium GWC2_42_7]|nr:MAG: hypothetical protein A2X59_05850 [Nitrospirae bacterium GWC2_42_7]
MTKETALFYSKYVCFKLNNVISRLDLVKNKKQAGFCRNDCSNKTVIYKQTINKHFRRRL